MGRNIGPYRLNRRGGGSYFNFPYALYRNERESEEKLRDDIRVRKNSLWGENSVVGLLGLAARSRQRENKEGKKRISYLGILIANSE